MSAGQQPSLSIVRTRDVVEMQAMFARADVRWLPQERGGPKIDFTVVRGNRASIHHLDLQSATFAEGAVDANSIAVILFRPRASTVVTNGEQLRPREVLLYGPRGEHSTSGGARDALVLTLPADDVLRRFTSLRRENPPDLAGRRFRLRLTAESFASLWSVFDCFLADTRAAAVGEVAPASITDLEQTVIDRMCSLLLTGWPPPPSALSSSRRKTVFRRAAEFVEHAAGGRLDLADICEAIGASEESMRLAFRDVAGISPMRYVKLLRMYRCRGLLKAGDPGHESVKSVALRCGFRELGRFAGEYRDLFGELPSETLQARRRRGPGLEVTG